MSGERYWTELRQGTDVVSATLADYDEIQDISDQLGAPDKIYLLGCGSSYWTAVVASYALRNGGYDAEPVHASEFLFSEYPLTDRTLVVGYSQSGETTETKLAMESVRDEAATLAVVNTPGSAIDELADHSFVTPAGDETAVLASKSVDAAITASYLLAHALAGAGAGVDEIRADAAMYDAILDEAYPDAVSTLASADCAYTLGVGEAYGLAGEAATKLGEGPLLHTTPYPALELSHGPIANAAGDPVLVFATDPALEDVYVKLFDELAAAGAETIAVVPATAEYGADVRMTLPAASNTVLPALKLVQKLVYDVTARLGYDPDDPPELSKYVDRSYLAEMR